MRKTVLYHTVLKHVDVWTENVTLVMKILLKITKSHAFTISKTRHGLYRHM